MRRHWLTSIAAILATATAATAHYHFVHFAGRNAPFTPIYEKFDVTALPDRTLTYFITEPNGTQWSSTDSFPALVSQIRAAAKVWNDVGTSDLRLAFGGVVPPDTPQPGPSVQILFGEIPPGIVAMGSPVTRADNAVTRGETTFIPIVRSVVILQSDLRSRPSFTEGVFGTLVHEIGHTFGLQHSFASSVMSTGTTRATSRAIPLTADDVAAVSTLYPKGNLQSTTGTITGRVTLDGAGVNLASVVAVPTSGAAISTLTHPDGSYRMAGVPAGTYNIYVHPIPPPLPGEETNGGIIYPTDDRKMPFVPGAPFETGFYAGGRIANLPNAEDAIAVAAGQIIENINFAVRGRTGHGIHSVETYAFPANTAVKPPYLSPEIAANRRFLVAFGQNLVSGSSPVAGLTARVIGGPTLGVRPYPPAPSSYVQFDVDPGALTPSDSARHLVLSTPNSTYVLPSAFYYVGRSAPSIAALTATGTGASRTVTIAGTNLTTDTRVLFDGVQSQVRNMDDQGRLVVTPPAGPQGHYSVVTALNPDGQSSLFLQADAPPAYQYPSEGPPAVVFTLNPNTLSPGMEAMITVDGLNTNFTEGQFQIGFSTTDVTVRRVWVQSPTRALVNVLVSPAAQPGFHHVTVVSGLNLMRQQYVFQIQAPQARPFWLTTFALNPSNGQSTLTPGAPVMMLVGASPVALSTTNAAMFLNDVRVPLTAAQDMQITFQVPASMAPGPVVARLEAGGERSLPILLLLEAPPRPEGPRITNIVTATSSQARSARAGEMISVIVADVPKASASKLSITLAGRELRNMQIFEEYEQYNMFVVIPADTPAGENVPLVVSFEGRASEPVSLTITR